MEFSEKLKTLRMQANLTQNDLAEKLAISRQAVSNYEQGRSYPSIDILIEMSKLFKISLDELLESGRRKLHMKLLLIFSTLLIVSITMNYVSFYVLERNSTFSLLHLVFGIAFNFIPFLCLITYLLFQYRPPKIINKIYGYRSKLSMRNQLMWNYAQNYFSEICINIAILLIGLNIIFAIISIFLNTLSYLIVSCVFLFSHAICFLISICLVEKQLKLFYKKSRND